LAHPLRALPQLDDHVPEILSRTEQFEGTRCHFAVVSTLSTSAVLRGVALDLLRIEKDEPPAVRWVERSAFQTPHGRFSDAETTRHLFARQFPSAPLGNCCALNITSSPRAKSSKHLEEWLCSLRVANANWHSGVHDEQRDADRQLDGATQRHAVSARCEDPLTISVTR